MSGGAIFTADKDNMLLEGLSTLDLRVEAARRRIHAQIDILHAKARAETESMAESARRSIGQRFRYWKVARDEAR